MSIRPRTPYDQKRLEDQRTRTEILEAKLVPSHYRQLLGWIYGAGAESEQLWDDSYIPEIEAALATISRRQFLIIRARLLGTRHNKIARLLMVTPERIRWIESQTLNRLHRRSGLKVIIKLRLRLCVYPARSTSSPLVRARFLPPQACVYCGQPKEQGIRFPPCPIRIARLMQQA